jgi:CubicO group peptidase (beta-lactamase class C family)
MKFHALAAACLLCSVPAAPLLAQQRSAAWGPSKAEAARFAQDLLNRRYPADGPGGAVLVARGDTILFRGARGEADAGKGVKLRPDSVFRMGSVAKQFAAAGVLKLVEAGKVKLDDPLSKYVPGYPGGDRITVLQLLNHTAGVRNYTEIPGYMEGAPIRRDLTTAQLIRVFKDEPPAFAPGEKWGYSNSGYVLLGAVIEAVSGEPWHAYLGRVLFGPLGMRHTGYAGDPERVARQVRGHSYDAGKLVPPAPISMTQPHAAGSLLSNVDDLFRWNRALHEGRVLRSPAYTQMITPVGKARDVGYGFGLYVDRLRKETLLRHRGGISGFLASLDYVPGPDISVVVLENDDWDSDREGGEGIDAFARRLAAKALGDPYPEPRAVPVAAAALGAAEGVYLFPGEVTRILRIVGGKLTSRRGARGDLQPLTPVAVDDFLYPDGFNRLRLERDSAGKVVGARFFPRGDGEGEAGVRSGDASPSAGAAAAPALPRAALLRLAGTYAHEQAGLSLDVYMEGDELLARIAGQPPVTLRATSASGFEVEETGASLEFAPGRGPAGEVTMRQSGREISLRRVP